MTSSSNADIFVILLSFSHEKVFSDGVIQNVEIGWLAYVNMESEYLTILSSQKMAEYLVHSMMCSKVKHAFPAVQEYCHRFHSSSNHQR